MKRSDQPLAVDVCPHAKHCQHRATSRIGGSGTCPDCGTQVFRRSNPYPASRGAGSFLAQERRYQGGWLD